MHSLCTRFLLWLIRPVVERIADERIAAAMRPGGAIWRNRSTSTRVERVASRHVGPFAPNGGRWHLGQDGKFDVNPGDEPPEGASSCRS
jgi:hypothetical protein